MITLIITTLKYSTDYEIQVFDFTLTQERHTKGFNPCIVGKVDVCQHRTSRVVGDLACDFMLDFIHLIIG